MKHMLDVFFSVHRGWLFACMCNAILKAQALQISSLHKGTS